jgi:membrane protein YqaA with SNARE-associated domain
MKYIYSHIAIYAIAIFAIGLVLGGLVEYEITRHHPDSSGEEQWHNEHNKSSRGSIRLFQDALNKQSPATNIEELVQRMDAQWKVEELVIKSHAAEFSTFTTFTPLVTACFSLITSILGLVGGWYLKKHGVVEKLDKP